MEIGMYALTHGIGVRNEENFFAQSIPGQEMRPVKIAQMAERIGMHSMWFPDHVCMPISSTSGHVANESRTRAYDPRHNLLDAAPVMGAVAASTSRLRLGTSVLIAPYRGPLNDARQFATIDVLSAGRLILGVGAGWLAEEFEALDLPYEDRGAMTEECIEIYKRSWTDDVVAYQGKHYKFDNLSMDPKPVQKPRPPIVFGSVVPAGARRAAQLCDGFYPIFLDPWADPHRFAPLQDIIRSELDAAKKDPGEFSMLCISSVRVTDADDPEAQRSPRKICTGAPDQILSDLQRYADAGYSLVVFIFDCPSGQVAELEEQVERIGAEVIPHARFIQPAGGWKQSV